MDEAIAHFPCIAIQVIMRRNWNINSDESELINHTNITLHRVTTCEIIETNYVRFLIHECKGLNMYLLVEDEMVIDEEACFRTRISEEMMNSCRKHNEKNIPESNDLAQKTVIERFTMINHE